jgi:hypothetical protein
MQQASGAPHAQPCGVGACSAMRLPYVLRRSLEDTMWLVADALDKDIAAAAAAGGLESTLQLGGGPGGCVAVGAQDDTMEPCPRPAQTHGAAACNADEEQGPDGDGSAQMAVLQALLLEARPAWGTPGCISSGGGGGESGNSAGTAAQLPWLDDEAVAEADATARDIALPSYLTEGAFSLALDEAAPGAARKQPQHAHGLAPQPIMKIPAAKASTRHTAELSAAANGAGTRISFSSVPPGWLPAPEAAGEAATHRFGPPCSRAAARAAGEAAATGLRALLIEAAEGIEDEVIELEDEGHEALNSAAPMPFQEGAALARPSASEIEAAGRGATGVMVVGVASAAAPAAAATAAPEVAAAAEDKVEGSSDEGSDPFELLAATGRWEVAVPTLELQPPQPATVHAAGLHSWAPVTAPAVAAATVDVPEPAPAGTVAAGTAAAGAAVTEPAILGACAQAAASPQAPASSACGRGGGRHHQSDDWGGLIEASPVVSAGLAGQPPAQQRPGPTQEESRGGATAGRLAGAQAAQMAAGSNGSGAAKIGAANLQVVQPTQQETAAAPKLLAAGAAASAVPAPARPVLVAPRVQRYRALAEAAEAATAQAGAISEDEEVVEGAPAVREEPMAGAAQQQLRMQQQGGPVFRGPSQGAIVPRFARRPRMAGLALPRASGPAGASGGGGGGAVATAAQQGWGDEDASPDTITGSDSEVEAPGHPLPQMQQHVLQ